MEENAKEMEEINGFFHLILIKNGSQHNLEVLMKFWDENLKIWGFP